MARDDLLALAELVGVADENVRRRSQDLAGVRQGLDGL
jgi:hypothetical protein